MTNEALVKAIREGNAQPIDLWQSLKRFIRVIALKYVKSEEDPLFEDLMQESYFGLLSAIRLYRPDEGSFTTYAHFWLKNRMQRYILNHVKAVRVPVDAAMMVRRLDRVVSAFQRDHSRPPSEAELCEALEVTGEQLAAIRAAKVMSSVSSLDIPVGEDQTSDTLADLAPDRTVNVEEEALNKVQQEELAETLWRLVDDHLTEQQAATIRGKYKEGRSQQEIAAALGVTGSRVHNIELDALRRLRTYKIRKQLEPFLDDIRYSVGITGGLRKFEQTGASSTEKAALEAIRRYEQLKKELGL